MPAMRRMPGKATKIAYKILGVPANIKYSKKNPKEQAIDKRLTFVETQRVR